MPQPIDQVASINTCLVDIGNWLSGKARIGWNFFISLESGYDRGSNAAELQSVSRITCSRWFLISLAGVRAVFNLRQKT